MSKESHTSKLICILFKHVQERRTSFERTIGGLDCSGQILGDQVVGNHVGRLPATSVHPTVEPVDVAIRSTVRCYIH